MKKDVQRKRLALLIADPASDYSQSVIKGVRDQCARYNYDLLVFSTMVKVCHHDQLYLNGELNIYKLVNYDLVDGVLVASLSLYEDQVKSVLEMIEADLRLHCTKPVVSLDLPFAEYPAVYTDDRKAIREVVKHLVRTHHCRKLYLLTGHKDYVVSEARAEAFCEQLQAEGLDASREAVFYGNFWYTGGEEFANRLLFGELDMPDAVVCANDYMAIGLAERLMSYGVKVPDDVLITGYDATKEALFNTVSITTYTPDVYGMAAHGVDMIHAQIEPETPEAEIGELPHCGLQIGASCGCAQSLDAQHWIDRLGLNPRERQRNPDGSLTVNDMQGLHESYMFETLSVIQEKQQILQTITDVSYLLQPYRRFYLVLRNDWSDPASRLTSGYPETMRCVMRTIPQTETPAEGEDRYSTDSEQYCFLTKQMLPALDEKRDEPVVFYFLPSHFSDDTIGYAVLQTAMDARRTADEVVTLWIRNVNNALQMVRIVGRLLDYSIRDSMTGLLNRRGMEIMYKRCMGQIHPDDYLVVWVIDMDGLKLINDHYGHEAGDIGIITIADAIRQIAGKEDIMARIGGDEFTLIAAGDLTEEEGQERIRAFEKILADKNAARSGRPYDITGSIGYVRFPASEMDAFEEMMKEADRRMYAYKTAHKKQRSS
ncbi:MAG: GGDEF domain-containing protein [Oscillospiraceae bacterium]|nr:GGDEF domain-containing protein [Oscillospiraceae bacterium]